MSCEKENGRLVEKRKSTICQPFHLSETNNKSKVRAEEDRKKREESLSSASSKFKA